MNTGILFITTGTSALQDRHKTSRGQWRGVTLMGTWERMMIGRMPLQRPKMFGWAVEADVRLCVTCYYITCCYTKDSLFPFPPV